MLVHGIRGANSHEHAIGLQRPANIKVSSAFVRIGPLTPSVGLLPMTPSTLSAPWVHVTCFCFAWSSIPPPIPPYLTPLSYPSSSLSPSGRLADAVAQESDPPIMPPAINGSLSPGAYGGHHQFHCNPHPPSPPRPAGSRRWVIHILWPVTTAKQPVAQGAGGICRLYVVNASCICRLYVVRVLFDVS